MRRQAFLAGSIAIAVVAIIYPIHEAAAQSQHGPQAVQTQQESHQQQSGMMGGGMMDKGMMGGGMMNRHHRGAMGGGMMMRMMFSLMDADGDGSISLQEFQAAHERIFKGIDQNKDGRITMEEMQSFMGAGPTR
jgi:hypothetical protein